MAEDLAVKVIYYDVSTGEIYDSSGKQFENNTLVASLDSKFNLELHYVANTSTNVSPEGWEVWSFLDGKEISSTLAYDEDYIHAYEGKVASDVEQAASSITVKVSGVNKDTLSPFGILIVNPFGSEIEQEVILYSSFKYVSKDTYSFTIEDSAGSPSFIASNTPVRVSDPLFIFVDSSKIYEANIPNRYNEGIFTFPMNILSRKLLLALDNTNITGVSGKLEHKIYLKKSKLVGINVSGSEEIFTRNIKKDKVAVDSTDSKSYVFCCWSNENTDYWTKGNDVQDGFSLYIVENTVATLTENTLTCSFEVNLVLAKTFQIPFIVKNLVDYNVTLNVPLQDADWVKKYIISTVRANVDEAVPITVIDNAIDCYLNANGYVRGSSVSIGSDDEPPPT